MLEAADRAAAWGNALLRLTRTDWWRRSDVIVDLIDGSSLRSVLLWLCPEQQPINHVQLSTYRLGYNVTISSSRVTQWVWINWDETLGLVTSAVVVVHWVENTVVSEFTLNLTQCAVAGISRRLTDRSLWTHHTIVTAQTIWPQHHTLHHVHQHQLWLYSTLSQHIQQYWHNSTFLL